MMILALAAISVTALGLGAAVGWLWSESRSRRRDLETRSALAAAQQQASALQETLTAEQQSATQWREQLAQARTDHAVSQSQLESTRANLDEQKRLLQDAQAKLRDVFASLSADALSKNNQAFLQLAKENFTILTREAAGDLDQRSARIDAQIKPLRELMGQYQQRLGEIEKSRNESYSQLRQQLGTLTESQRALNTQTHQLVNALNRTNTRGQWGEIALRRLVELAGMTRWCDFVEQSNVATADGWLRPDMIVQLPGDRQIAIDSKVPLEAFLDASAATDDDARRNCLQRHAQQVRTRCRELSRKSYGAQLTHSPEFVIMFLPGEAFLYAAVELDGSLIEDALKSDVIIATPTTLIALLKTVAYGWRQEQMTENAEKIRELGGQLYERIATWVEHFDKLGKSLNSTIETYNAAVGSVESRLLVTARKLNELGANTGGKDKQAAEPQPVDTRARPLTIS